MTTDQAASVAQALKALADPVRLRLLSLLRAWGQARVGDLAAEFDLSQPTISHHLNVLFDAGLVLRTREATSVIYRPNPSALDEVADLIGSGRQPSELGKLRLSAGRAQHLLTAEAVDQVLTRGIADLAFRYAGSFGAETVDRYVHESYQTLYRTARVKTHLPQLTLRFAAERLAALAQATGRAPKPVPEVLFVCTHNSGRSQIAAALTNHISAGQVHVRSAGSLPGAGVNPTVVQVMAERGLDISAEYPKPITDDFIRAADVVITMGCGDACPIYPGKRYLDWELADPAGQPADVVREIADRIETKVRQLLGELGLETVEEDS